MEVTSVILIMYTRVHRSICTERLILTVLTTENKDFWKWRKSP